MRLSDYQAIFLVNVLYDSSGVQAQFGGLTPKRRLELYREIIEQQDHKVVELGDLPSTPEDENGQKQARTDS